MTHAPVCVTPQQSHIMAERNVLLKNVRHPFLVGLRYSFQTAEKLYFVLDYVNGGEVSGPARSPPGRLLAGSCPSHTPAAYTGVWTDCTSSLQQTLFVVEETEPQKLIHLLKATQQVP